jgi:hypothetical protein
MILVSVITSNKRCTIQISHKFNLYIEKTAKKRISSFNVIIQLFLGYFKLFAFELKNTAFPNQKKKQPVL